SNGIPDWMEFDFDCDGVPDYIDWDIDGDGVPNEWDAHPFNSNIGNEDFSGSGIPDWMEFDTSGNGIPDYLDPDIDGDGIPNYLDPNPFDPNIGPGIVQQSYPTQSFNVSECGVLNIPGIYHLVEDITTSGNCFNITVSGITFRGNGNSIISNNNGIAFHSSNVNNIIIYDTNIRNFNNAILFVNVDNALIYQNIIKSNLNWAIRLDLSKNNTIANNTIKDNDNGIYLHSPDAIYGSGMLSFPDRTTNNRIHNNIIIRSGQSIIFHGHGTHSNTVNHNIIYEGVFGIHLYAESANNSIIYNSIYDSISFGLGCDRCHYNNYYHNIIDSGLSGIDLIFKCNQNHFRNNTITNVDYGVFFRNWGDCNNNIISDSNISSLVFGVFGTNPGSYFSQHKNNSFLNITYVNESNNGRYELVRKWYLIANVTSANGTGIPNTEVILSNSSGVISQKLTNSKGHAIFDVVDYINDGPLNQFGNYTLSVGGISEEINFVNYNMVINFTDAIPIHNCIDLQNIRNDLTAHYYLANNIDCSDTINWNDGLGFEPIGDCGGNSCWEEPNNPFSGRLDGKGYIISNLSISRPEQNYVAIFSLINNSVISNLGMDSFNVIGRDVVSTLVADARDSYIEKVFSKNSYVYGRVGVGGLTGWAFNSNIINSYTNGIVIAQDAYAGGITAAHGNIYNSFSIANVSANNILGNNEGIVGGLTSEIHSAGGSISNSYFVGHVNSDSNINQYGGILGRLWGVGPNILNNVYWYNSSESIAINCYWNGNTNCNSINHLNFFMEHISNSLYSNWDIASSSNDLNNGYPYLAWQSGATNAIWLIYQPSFYEKDGTIYCYSANIGETGVVNGIVYTAYNNTGLYSIRNNASLLESACTSHVTSFQVLFMNSGSSFQPNINHWDTSSVTNMFQMFAYSGFDQEISNWDTSSVTDMIQMFAYSSFNQQISYWNTSSVNNMAGMFYNAFRFNQDLSAWCVSNIGSKPGNFDFGSSFENQNHLHPQWGLCP
ncbi:MAG: BspA family leucine-rich repeat surface protein, partial [Candidatus Woesearchaeota archaeon]